MFVEFLDCELNSDHTVGLLFCKSRQKNVSTQPPVLFYLKAQKWNLYPNVHSRLPTIQVSIQDYQVVCERTCGLCYKILQNFNYYKHTNLIVIWRLLDEKLYISIEFYFFFLNYLRFPQCNARVYIHLLPSANSLIIKFTDSCIYSSAKVISINEARIEP
jgi:hypothetical protein